MNQVISQKLIIAFALLLLELLPVYVFTNIPYYCELRVEQDSSSATPVIHCGIVKGVLTPTQSVVVVTKKIFDVAQNDNSEVCICTD